MKTITLLFVLTFCLLLVGCKGPVTEVRAFIDEKSEILLKMSEKIEANPTEAGVDEARQVFEERKAGLIAKRDAPELNSKNLAKYGDLLVMLSQSDVNDTEIFGMLHSKLRSNHAYSAESKLSALQKDFKEVVKSRR